MSLPTPQESPRDPADGARTAWSCMLGDAPATWSAFAPWLATALGPGRIAPRDIVVHHATPLRGDIDALCARFGLRTVQVDAFDARRPHCNLLRRVETDYGDATRVVLVGVDMAFAARLPIESIDAPVAGKLVDAASPPLHILQRVFGAAGVAMPEVRTQPSRNGDAPAQFRTFLGNFDDGLYVLEARALRDVLGPRWMHWGRWLLERAGLLERWREHVDQVAFCLALADSGLHATALPDAWNVPMQARVACAGASPLLLHHHGKLDAHMQLDPHGAPDAADAIARANAAIECFQRDTFDNRTFWNHRYAAHPALGSGHGSRGETLVNKRAWLTSLTALAPGASLLDWGCGDLEVTRTLPCGDGTGVDVAVEALRVARTKRPDWQFMTPTQFDALDGRPRDLVVCLDVLVHQRTRDEYLDVLLRLGPLARLGVVVAGYDAAPGHPSPITFFHEPLRATLAAMPDVIDAVPLMEYRDTTLYFAATSEAGRALIQRAKSACAA